MIANIASDDALILPHRANPAGLNFRERNPDAWPHFEQFIRDIAKAGPQHRKSKSKTKSSKNPERKKKAPPKRGQVQQ
jgi:hypothetical protein